MDRRVFGIETEFGCLVRDPAAGTAEEVVERVKDYAFYRKRIGAIDLHARNYAFEPARSGGFLVNGGRLYVDAVGSHEEYATRVRAFSRPSVGTKPGAPSSRTSGRPGPARASRS